ncbi:SEC-C metal-binding domain-containing protein, partial [Chloroflexota bacterium]
YPNILCDQVLTLVPSATANISSSILSRLAELDLPITNLEPLVELTRADVETELKALAGAILLRDGYALLPKEIESASTTLYADVIGSTEQGFDLILQTYRDFSGEHKSFFDDIAHICNFADLYRDLDNAETKKGTKKRIDYFRQLWECDNIHLEQLSQPEEILSALDQALEKAAPSESTPWKRGLLAELEHDRARMRALREISGERVSRWSIEERRFVLACILCLWRNEACWGHLIEATSVAELWRALITKPWRGVPGQALKDFLLSVEPKELLHSLSGTLRQKYSYASYAFGILNSLDTLGRFELFLDVYEGKKYGDILAEEAGKALTTAGAPAIEFIMERYPRMSQGLRTLILFVLDSFPTSEVVDFCLKHFDEYMSNPAPEEFAGCLEKIAASRFLPPLIQEWREGEAGIGRAIKLISEINNIRDGQIGTIIRDTEKRTRHPEDAIAKPISSFPLRCTVCGHTYEYELENIYVSEGGSAVIADVIQCKGCGSIETYEVPALTHFKFTAEMLRVVTAQKAQPERPLDSFATPFRLDQRVDMTVLGRKVKSTSEAYRLLKDEIEKHPQNADIQKRMGNLLKRGGKPELALPCFLEAVKLNSSDVESYHSIVAILIDQKRHREAIPYLERLVPACRESKIEEGLLRQIFEALLSQVDIVERETGHKVELFRLTKPEDVARTKEPITLNVRSFEPDDAEGLEWLYHAFRHGKVPKGVMKPDLSIEATQSSGQTQRARAASEAKIGRNDPCPCGSGKKYKKCCGR